METVNQTVIASASTVFEKVGEDYIGCKSRFGDILIGAPYSEAFVKAYANERKDVLVLPKTIEYTAFLRSDEMKKVAEGRQEAIKERAQARRDEIVEQAKADVKEQVNRYEYYFAYGRNTKAEFIVNYEKRTVVTILRKGADGQIVAKGIAKAAPDDCFNVHIGKAIALRRAMGLVVPDGYLNAPQPTEVRVGDVVRGNRGDSHYYSKRKTFTITSDNVDGIYDGFLYKENTGDWIERDQIGRIIDDSRAEVGE